MVELIWSCRCGATEVRVRDEGGNRVSCHCRDCQGFARYLGAAEILDDSGGSDLYNTLPDRLDVVRGGDTLKVLRMTPQGPLRWYAGCCNTPFANTATRPSMPFATVILNPAVDDSALGPVRFRVNKEGARGPVRDGGRGIGALAAVILWRGLMARLAGRHRITPFFDDDGRPVAEPRVLTREERLAALA